MPYPKMYAIRQPFAREREEDLRGAVQREIEKLKPHLQVRPGARVAITVGSRGIRNIAAIAGAVVDGVKSLGGRPFIFPAMGSPIQSSMAAVQIGQSREGIPVFLDKYASEADHVVVMNRVKSHTEFKGEIESGLMKMMLIGMGKYEGPKVYHKAFADYGFDRLVESLASVVIEKAQVLFGLAIV